MNMKRIAICFIAALFLLCNSSCNDELDGELFTKFVLLTNNGWIDEDIEIPEDGILEIPLIVSVNGTSRNAMDVSVELQWDSDTLAGYNFEKYRNQEGLYYDECPPSTVTFDDEIILIPAGEEKGISGLKVNLNEIPDIYQDYVIPISIKSVSEYEIGVNKYSKALIHLVLKNDYSGNYTGEAKVYEVEHSDKKLTVSTKTLYAVKNNEVYFYAGQFDRSSLTRDKYIVAVEFGEDGQIVSAEGVDPELEFELLESDVEITHIENELDPRKESVKTVLTMKYRFKNLDDSNEPLMEFDGTLTKLETVDLIK